MVDTGRMRFGPSPWICSSCKAENEGQRQQCWQRNRDPRTTLTDGTQVYPGHRSIIKEGPRAGQQEGYNPITQIVLRGTELQTRCPSPRNRLNLPAI